MVTASQEINWHTDTLPRSTKKALDFLSKQNWLKNSEWYLAGGTALSLQTGNRRSVDLDFFSQAKHIENGDILKLLSDEGDVSVVMDRKDTLYIELFGAKASFIAYPFFVPKQTPHWYGCVRVLDKTDIAVMKIIAVSQRGRKRDFFDLYWCANNIEPLDATIKRLKVQYPSVAHDYHHILKALVYFQDAESDPDPDIHFKVSWRTVKRFFLKEIPRIAKRIIK